MSKSPKLSNSYTNALSRPLEWDTAFTEADFDQLTRDYQAYTGTETLEIPEPRPLRRGHAQFQFASIMFDGRPDALKRYRLQMNTLLSGTGLEHALPTSSPVFALIWGHYYITAGYPEGVIADIAATRARGARKDEVAHLLSLGWLNGGNIAMNSVAGYADAYMRAWDPDDGAPGLNWPASWTSDPLAFQCGIDFKTGRDQLSPDELGAIEQWYKHWQGEVPRYVRFLGKHFPVALKAYRARFENAMVGPLPSQMVVLLQVHLAVEWMRPDALRRYVQMAKLLGLSKDEVAQVIAFGQLYVSDSGMDAALEGVEPLFDTWDAG